MRNTFFFSTFWVILFFGGCQLSSDGSGGGSPAPVTAERLVFAGVGTHGIFDPSVTRDPDNGRLWMSYSAVDPSASWPTQNYDVVATRLAYSDDNGGSWTDSGSAVSGFLDVTLPLAPPHDAGTWVSEVSQLIYDPGAIPGERWKLLWHHYLNINNSRHFEHGWIAMKMASAPENLATAPEIKLFSGFLYDAGNDILGGNSRSPVGGAPLIQLDLALDAELNTCVFSEPGMYATSGALYLSLLCVRLSDANRLIAMFKCASPCATGSSASWAYLGTVLQRSDAASFGFDTGFSASSMFASGGSIYMVVTPVQTAGAPWGDYYSGCRLFRFADIDSALLQQAGSRPTLIAAIDGAPGTFNGACGYHASATRSGLLYSELNTSVTDRFRIFMSHENFQ